MKGHEYELSIQVGNDLRVAEEMGILAQTDQDGGVNNETIVFECTDRNGLLASWTCKLEPSDKGKRIFMELQLQIIDFGMCMLAFSVKVYPPKLRRHVGMDLGRVLAKYAKESDEVRLKSQQWVQVHR
jgi:hypothetical protein